MKKEAMVVISAMVVILLIATGIYIGEANAAELERISRVEGILNRTAGLSGYESLGVIDGYAISQRNGKTYDGPAIRDELFGRAGMEAPDNCWAFTLDTVDGITLIKLVVYKGEITEPIFDQEVEKVYLYGVL